MSINIPDSRKEVSDRMLTDVQSELKGSRPFLRNSFLGALIKGLAGRVFEFYVQLETLQKNLFPDTATGEFADRWGAFLNITRNLPTTSAGFLTIEGIDGSLIPDGTLFQADGNQYISLNPATLLPLNLTISELTFSAGIATVLTSLPHNLASSINVTISGANNSPFNGDFEIIVTGLSTFTYLPTSTPPPSDGITSAVVDTVVTSVEIDSVETGQDKNLGNGAKITLTSPIAGINNSGFSQFSEIGGGTDVEDPEAFRNRYLNRYRNPNTPFNVANIVDVSKKISGVTRVFVFEPDLTAGAFALTSLDRIDDKTIKATFGVPHGLLSGNYITVAGADQTEYNIVDVPVVAPNTTELVYAVPSNPVVTPATGVIRAEFSDLQPGQTKVLFMRDNDVDPIPTPLEVADVKTQLLTIKPAHMAEVDLIVEAPIPKLIDFEFEFIIPRTATMRNSVKQNLVAFFRDQVQLGRVIDESIYNSVIFNTIDIETGERLQSFRLVNPTGDIQPTPTEIPLLGDVTFN